MLDRSATLLSSMARLGLVQGHVPEGIIHLQATGRRVSATSGGLVKQAGSFGTQGDAGGSGEGGKIDYQFGFRFFADGFPKGIRQKLKRPSASVLPTSTVSHPPGGQHI